MTEDHRTFRQVVRVVIVREGKICVCKIFRKKPSQIKVNVKTSKIKAYVFPGGGVEKDQTPEQAAEAECLQEVGIKIKNVKPLHLSGKVLHQFQEQDRKDSFKGTDIHYYIAEYDGKDDSLYNIEGDAMQYEWMYPYDALLSILKDSKSPFLYYHRRAVELANKDIVKKIY